MIYPNNFESKIGFDFIRKSIESKCISTLGVGECANIQFLTDYNSIISKLNETNEFLNILNGADEFPMESIYDTTHALNHIRIVGTYITEGELFNLKRTLITIADIRAFFNKGINEENPDNHPYPYLHTLTADIENFPHIITEIDKVLDKYGNVKENATPTLANIVKSIANTTASINGMIRRIISSGRQSGILEKDTTPTIRDGRLVIPVPPMHKRKIRGIIHDESATGKTIFIEPAEIVEANNNIRELQTEMQREIIRILTTVADTIRPHITELLNSYTILGKLDVIKAKAHFAQQYNCLLPNMHSTPQVEWYHAIHPLLSSTLQEQGKSIVPLNVTLDATNRILIISGPNAGGKSVCLKTV
ncbi:MAG: endonuclease MutS2, partial [Bacteroidales bacterium]